MDEINTANKIESDIYKKIRDIVIPALQATYDVGRVAGEEYSTEVISKLTKLFYDEFGNMLYPEVMREIRAREAYEKVAGTERVERGGCRVAGCEIHPISNSSPLSEDRKYCYCYQYRTKGNCKHMKPLYDLKVSNEAIEKSLDRHITRSWWS